MINVIVVNPYSDRFKETLKVSESDWRSESMLVNVLFAQGARWYAHGMMYRVNLKESA
jgi:hypothetical protein